VENDMVSNKPRQNDFKERVAIVYPFPYFDTIPSLFNAAQSLSQHAFGVDIFTRTSSRIEKPSFDDARIQVFEHADKEGLYQSMVHSLSGKDQNDDRAATSLTLRLIGILRQVIPTAFLLFISNAMSTVDRFIDSFTVWRRHRICPYRCFIGVDAKGLVLARQLSMSIDVPLIYWSLELLLSQELKDKADLVIKRKEATLSKKAAFIVIQDELRARLLAEDNDLPVDKFILVPNTPLGPVHRRRLHHWHKRFGLSPDKKIVIHAGSIGTWTGISEIVTSTDTWPEDRVLVVHTRTDSHQTQEILELQRRADPERVFFSTHPSPRTEYDDLIDSADIGIAFYILVPDSSYTQENIRSIGLSSGKVAYYLRSGLPIIINNTTSLSDLVKDEGCGVVINDEQEIGQAIEEISRNYDKYRNNSYRCFEKRLNFTDGFAQVIKSIESL
jgi:glycosyltransferase involved in cell wall biosynthesis